MSPAASLQSVIRNYSLFLHLVSDLFSAATAKHSARCRPGCHRCCSTGLFDISLLDALYLQANLKRIRESTRNRVIANSIGLLGLLDQKKIITRTKPFLRSAAARNRFALRSSGMRCPALDRRNRCLIYEHRPLLCRIFGPAVRGERRAVLLEGCGRFSRELPEADFPVLSIYKDEDVLLKALYAATGIRSVTGISTIIPAALALDINHLLPNR